MLTTTVAFNEDVLGGTEPAGTTITLRIDKDGFHDAGGMGGAGQVVEPVGVDRVAELLRTEFDTEALRAILAHLTELGRALET
jgi:hypothetical protein